VTLRTVGLPRIRTFGRLDLCHKGTYVLVEGEATRIHQACRQGRDGPRLVRRQCGLTSKKPPLAVPLVSKFWNLLGVKFPLLVVPPPLFVPPVAV
jgi:hypothetical protein